MRTRCKLLIMFLPGLIWYSVLYKLLSQEGVFHSWEGLSVLTWPDPGISLWHTGWPQDDRRVLKAELSHISASTHYFPTLPVLQSLLVAFLYVVSLVVSSVSPLNQLLNQISWWSSSSLCKNIRSQLSLPTIPVHSLSSLLRFRPALLDSQNPHALP